MKISARDIDHLSLTLSDPGATASRLLPLGFNLTPDGVEPRCICFQPDQDDVPNYIELLQGHPAVVAVALNVTELEGEERTHAWETEDGFEVDAGVVVGESGGPLAWFPVRHETPDAFMEPEWIVHPNGALAMMAIHAVAEEPREVAKALPAVVGATIAIERSPPLQALLRANNVSFEVGEDKRVLVGPEQAGGLMLEFMPQT